MAARLNPPRNERLDNNRTDPRTEPGFEDPNPQRTPAPNPEYSRNDYGDRAEEEAVSNPRKAPER